MFPARIMFRSGKSITHHMSLIKERLYSFRAVAIVALLKTVFRTPYLDLFTMAIPGTSQVLNRVAKAALMLLLASHVDTCLFWFMETQISDPRRYISVKKIATPSSFGAAQSQYLELFGGSLRGMMLKTRKVNGGIAAENVYGICELLVGILVSGTFVGMIHSVVTLLDRNNLYNLAEQESCEKANCLHEILRNAQISVDVQKVLWSCWHLMGKLYARCTKDQALAS
ncbi:hypothetical protein HDU96_010579 [Phlyctochytrium bullatum]|nr:hypothetical protein HDU96_010579 [Phlyctochytrium bullatum]